jgi:hypothetical protein
MDLPLRRIGLAVPQAWNNPSWFDAVAALDGLGEALRLGALSREH